MDKKEQHQIKENDGNSSPAQSDISRASTASQSSLGTESDLPTCRVCHCIESDKRGDAVLGFLGITPPVQALQDKVDVNSPNPKNIKKAQHEKDNNAEGVLTVESKCDPESGRIEFISPEGEVFVCKAADVEVGLSHHQDALMELGCSCKSDLALVHYACALKWFISHGSTACEICGRVASNVRSSDFRKVLASLKEYEALRERTASGLLTTPQEEHDESSGVDPDALAAIRRQRLSEISLWFNPHNNNNSNFYMSNSENHDHHLDEQQQARLEQIVVEQQHSTLENVLQSENRATKWAVEGTGILLATGLLTVTLAWLLAPHVGKRTAQNGLHILLGGVCALAVVIFFRFFVLTRIRYGPARYWAILFVFWFLVFGIWASRTHGSHST